MNTYHKIPTIYKRNPKTRFRTLLEGEYTTPELKYLSNNKWIGTEKIDGMNIRIIFCGDSIFFAGRTDDAQIPKCLSATLLETYNLNAFDKVFGNNSACLYGEGYGAKIQNGGNYISSNSFILFDIKIEDIWLNRESVIDIASKLSIDVVPEVFQGTLTEAVEFAKIERKSTIGTAKMEGIVLRPQVELSDRLNNRIITKIKHKDF